MSFAFIENGSISQYPIGLADIRQRFPYTSFVKPLEGQDLSSFGVVEVVLTEQPSFDSNVKKLEEGTPALDGGTWRQVWNLVDLSSDELQRIETNKAANIRAERNKKLANTDWTQLADSTANATAWGTYRQALRDLPTTEGFPHNLTWPTEPS